MTAQSNRRLTKSPWIAALAFASLVYACADTTNTDSSSGATPSGDDSGANVGPDGAPISHTDGGSTPGYDGGIAPGTDGGHTGVDGSTATDGGVVIHTDAGVKCTNTDRTTIPITAAGWTDLVCTDSKIQGSWYCYSDGVGASSCVSGKTPYVAASAGMCLSGSTSTSASAYGAGIGLGLNESGGLHSVKSAYNATANNVVGFEITISGSAGGSALRVGFTGAAMSNNPAPFVSVPGVGTYKVLFADAVVPSAWAVPNAGAKVDPTSIFDVQVAVPVGAVAVNYNFCITEMKPILANQTGTGGGCTALTSYGNPVCGKGDMVTLTDYALQNDIWNGAANGTQCVQATNGGSCAGFTVTPNLSIGGDTPASYPSLIYGWQNGSFYGGYQTAKQVSAIGTMPSTWTFTVPGGGKWDTSYDIWFAPTSAPKTANGGLEMMIWPASNGPNPAGNPTGRTAHIGGSDWQVYSGTVSGSGGSWSYYAYKRASNSSGTVSLDLAQFYADAANDHALQTSWYLLGVQAGFEIWNQTQAMVTNSFTVSMP